MKSSSSTVTITTPQRLHFGFVDLNGSLGRRFGSLGLTLDQSGFIITAKPSQKINAEGPQAERAHQYASLLQNHFNLSQGLELQVEQEIAPHCGLGSGTQLAFAIAAAYSALYDLKVSPDTICKILNRGKHSSIGIGAFMQGGFLVDGGVNSKSSSPKIVCRHEFPNEWRILLINDLSLTGLHGAPEDKAFQKMPDFAENLSAQLCHSLFMQILPGLLDTDMLSFGLGVQTIQKAMGDYFSPLQGGSYTSNKVAKVIATLNSQGVVAAGQSSWGPTGFAVFESDAQAHQALNLLNDDINDLDFKICSGCNVGAKINMET